jgi:hypothetical protein
MSGPPGCYGWQPINLGVKFAASWAGRPGGPFSQPSLNLKSKSYEIFPIVQTDICIYFYCQ